MLKISNRSQVLFSGLVILLLMDFFLNVWVGSGVGTKKLGVDDWDKSALARKSSFELFPVNAFFGLKPEVNAEVLRIQNEKDEADRLAKLKAEQDKEKREVLTIGKEDIRLFGISFSGDKKVALFKISGVQGNERVLKLAAGEELAIQNSAFTIKIEQIEFDSVQLKVENVKAHNKQVFNLAMFKYEF